MTTGIAHAVVVADPWACGRLVPTHGGARDGCVTIHSTMRTRRPGKTVTRSISIDLETDRVLREQADAHHGGNVSTLIVALAKDARQRAAAGDLLRRFDIPPLTDEEAEELLRESTAPIKKRRKLGKRRAA
jgi:hypothetical protein